MFELIIAIILTYFLFKKIILPWARKDGVINAEENKELYPFIYGYDYDPAEEE